MILELKMSKTNRLFENLIWCTTTEAAEYLRLSENAFRILASRYKLPKHRLGKRSVRYKLSDLDNLLIVENRLRTRR